MKAGSAQDQRSDRIGAVSRSLVPGGRTLDLCIRAVPGGGGFSDDYDWRLRT